MDVSFHHSLFGGSFPKPHECTEIVRRHDADKLPGAGNGQHVALAFIQFDKLGYWLLLPFREIA